MVREPGRGSLHLGPSGSTSALGQAHHHRGAALKALIRTVFVSLARPWLELESLILVTVLLQRPL